MIPSPFLQSDIQDPADGIALRNVFHLVQMDNLLVDSLKDERDDSGQDEEQQKDTRNDRPRNIGQDDSQRT